METSVSDLLQIIGELTVQVRILERRIAVAEAEARADDEAQE